MRVFSQAILKLDARAVALAMFLSVFIVSGAAWAQCPLPSGNNAAEGVLIYNSDHKVMQYCNGDNWVGVWGGGSGSGLPTCDDGEIAQWQGGKWECNDGSALPQEKIGTLTNGRWCTTNGSVINCTANPPLVTELIRRWGRLQTGNGVVAAVRKLFVTRIRLRQVLPKRTQRLELCITTICAARMGLRLYVILPVWNRELA